MVTRSLKQPRYRFYALALIRGPGNLRRVPPETLDICGVELSAMKTALARKIARWSILANAFGWSQASADQNSIELEQLGSSSGSSIYIFQQGSNNKIDGDLTLINDLGFGFLAFNNSQSPPLSSQQSLFYSSDEGSALGSFTFETFESENINSETFSDNFSSDQETITFAYGPTDTLQIFNTGGDYAVTRQLFNDDQTDAAATVVGSSQTIFLEQIGNTNLMSLNANGDNFAMVSQTTGSSNNLDVDVDDVSSSGGSSSVSIGMDVTGDTNDIKVMLARDDFDRSGSSLDFSGNDASASGDASNTDVGIELIGNTNDLFVDSDGGTDIARVGAFGNSNQIGIMQRGGSNTAVIDYTGSDSNLYVEQTGASNIVTMDLTGSSQTVMIVQNPTPSS